MKALGQTNRESYGGVRAVADMFNRLDSGTSKTIMADVENRDPALFETIRELMFVFEDLLLIDQGAIKEITARVDRKVLTIALKGTSEQLRNHIFATMSQRGVEMLKEDIDALGPVKIREVETAQQQIIAVVRQLDSEGVLSLKGTGGDQYVV
jgi:flagellar motor switch protein FliG